MKSFVIILFGLISFSFQGLFAQPVVQQIENANASYRKAAFERALQLYNNILTTDAANPYANFNAGNSLFRLKQFEKASDHYERTASGTHDAMVKAQAYYNEGVSLVKQNKLTEAVEAFKKSLRLNAGDNDARENLQKAITEMKRQQQQKEQQSRQNKPNEKNQPKKPQSPYSQDLMDRKLAELANEERKLQKQLQQKNQANRQLKDW